MRTETISKENCSEKEAIEQIDIGGVSLIRAAAKNYSSVCVLVNPGQYNTYIEMLKNGMMTLKQKCIDEITANEERCRSLVENSIGLVTALNPVLGYEKTTELAKEAVQTGKGILELIREKELLTEDQIKELLDPKKMTGQ